MGGGLEVDVPPGERQRDQEQDGDGDPADRGHDGPRAQRDRGVVALLLEEAHPGGEDRRRAAGQRAERVGELDRHGPAERQRPGHAADPFQAARHVRQLGQDQRHDDPQPLGSDHGVEGRGDVDEHADQGPAADERADDHDQRRPAHPAGLHQLRQLDRAGLGGPLADLLEQPLPAPQAADQQGVQGWFLQLPQRPGQQLRRQAPGRGVRRLGRPRPPPPSRPGRRPGRDQADPARPVSRRCGSPPHGGLRRRVDQHRVTADRAVGDASLPQDQQLAVQVIERAVGNRVGVGVGCPASTVPAGSR